MGAASAQKPLYASWQNNTADSWWKDPGLRMNCFYCAVLYFAVYVTGYDGSYLTGLQALDSWNEFFDYPSGNRLGLISASAYFPCFITCPFIAWSSDKFGRKPVIMFGAVGIVAGAVIGAAANGEAMLYVGRVLVGGSSGFLSVSAVCLLNELIHPRLRHISVALFLSTYYIGSIVAAWATFGCVYFPNNGNWGWRLPTLLQAFGPLIIIVNWFWLPESPRWLMANGRSEEGRAILERLHANGATQDELVENEIHEIQTALDFEAANQTTWASLFATPGNRKRVLVIATVALGSQWSGLGLVSYYLSPVLRTVGITNSAQQAGINGGLAVWNWLISIAGALLVERWGRRPIWLTSTALMLVFWAIFTALNATYANTGSSAAGSAVIAFIFLFNGSYDFAWTPLSYSYTSEILTYGQRAKGMSLFAVIQYVAVAVNQYVNPVALAAIEWKYYTVYIVLLVVYLALVYVFFIETKGFTSEEVGMLFDGKDKADEVVARALEAPLASSHGSENKFDAKAVKVAHIEEAA